MSAALTLAAMTALATNAARQHNVPVALVLAVARHESAFRPDAHRGEPHLGDASHGLMQLLLATAKSVGYSGTAAGAWNDARRAGTGLYDPQTNLNAGARFLRVLLNATDGDIARAISAYNAGLGNAKRAKMQSRFCSRWKATAPTTGRTLDRDCEVIRVVRVGEFPNQPYVDAVSRHLTTYGGSLSMRPEFTAMSGTGGGGPTGGTSSGPSVPSSSSDATTFVVRPSTAILIAAVSALAFIWKSLSGAK